MKSVEALGFGLITLGLIVVCSFIGRVEASSSELLPRSVIYYNDNGRELNFTSSRYTHLVLVINTNPCSNPVVNWTETSSWKCGSAWNSNTFANIRAKGVKVTWSIGGDPGYVPGQIWTSLASCTSSQLDNLASAIATFLGGSNACNAVFDGVDLDVEQNEVFNSDASITAVANFVFALRKALPSPQYIISHAPQAPYLCPNTNPFSSSECPTSYQNNYRNAYIQLLTKTSGRTGSTVLSVSDFISVQYYPTGNLNSYPGCTIDQWYLATSKTGIIWNNGNFTVPSTKLVMGSSLQQTFSTNGLPTLRSAWVNSQTGVGGGCNFGGVMGWQYSADTNAQWDSTAGSSLDTTRTCGSVASGSTTIASASAVSSASGSSARSPTTSSRSSGSPAPSTSSGGIRSSIGASGSTDPSMSLGASAAAPSASESGAAAPSTDSSVNQGSSNGGQTSTPGAASRLNSFLDYIWWKPLYLTK